MAIRESFVGVATADTRQKGGPLSDCGVPGSVNGPAGTDSADTIVALGIFIPARSAQVLTSAARCDWTVDRCATTPVAASTDASNARCPRLMRVDGNPKRRRRTS